MDYIVLEIRTVDLAQLGDLFSKTPEKEHKMQLLEEVEEKTLEVVEERSIHAQVVARHKYFSIYSQYFMLMGG